MHLTLGNDAGVSGKTFMFSSKVSSELPTYRHAESFEIPEGTFPSSPSPVTEGQMHH